MAKRNVAAPLSGCVVVITGTFPGRTQGEIKEILSRLGAATSAAVASSTTHVIATQADFDGPSARVAKAQARGLPVVGLAWLDACDAGNTRTPEQAYLLGAAPAALAAPADPTAPAPASQPSGKRPALPADGDDAPAEPRAKKIKADGDSPKRRISEVAVGQRAKSRDLHVPVDENCPLSSYAVYIDHDGLIWDASLNQTHSSNNSNKFYRLQLLHDGNTYKTWTRWGRVGDRGQTKTLGDGTIHDAIVEFSKKFKEKSGLSWDRRAENPRPGKYVFVERSYNPDSDDSDDEAGEQTRDEDAAGPQPCTLESPVQDLMRLIFNQQYFAANLTDLNYDANKMPLGKLSRAAISRGFEILKELAALIDDNSLAASAYGTTLPDAIETLSNSYYSRIPHDFRRNRPPVIHDYVQLKKEIELLESLGDMKDAELIMKIDRAGGVHPLDKQFGGLGLKEMTAVHPKSTEFAELAGYLNQTRAATHAADYQIEHIFRIERQGEHDRFAKAFPGPPVDRRLLWHGSRTTNFGGILSQGLRIAPPEAPVSGYMFGKGVYLADMSSKSANYCCSYISGGTALLLLCEAELGPLLTLDGANYTAGDDAKQAGRLSTWGRGMTGPSYWKDAGIVHRDLAGVKMPDVAYAPGPTAATNSHLLYNEYIVYDVAQIRLRYLFRVKM